MLQRLRQFGLTANPQKCMWGVAEVEYLGYKVGEGKVSVPGVRSVALREYLQPQTKKQLKSFLGMLGYYRRFIPVFSSIAQPLTEATKLKAPYQLMWTDDMTKAFVTLKDSPLQAHSVDYSLPDDTFTLSTDASGVA